MENKVKASSGRIYCKRWTTTCFFNNYLQLQFSWEFSDDFYIVFDLRGFFNKHNYCSISLIIWFSLPFTKYRKSKTTFKTSLNSHVYWDTLYLTIQYNTVKRSEFKLVQFYKELWIESSTEGYITVQYNSLVPVPWLCKIISFISSGSRKPESVWAQNITLIQSILVLLFWWFGGGWS